MDKKAIKTFAIESRKKLIEEVKYQASLLGITAEGIADPVEKAEGMEVYDIGASTPNTIYDEAINQRKSLVKKIKENGFDNVVEEVAYTWFNRIIAIRFMEVNDYLPTRVRVLSSENREKIEPDIIKESPNISLNFTDDEIKTVYNLKSENKLDEVFRFLFIKQCNKLNEILPELFEKIADYSEILLSISYINEDSVVRQLVNNISEEDFKDQVEIIGWLYQYYITELNYLVYDGSYKKDKIPKELLPAATQLFTPHWPVKYMVENSLGRLWLDSHPNDKIKTNWKYYLEDKNSVPENSEKLDPKSITVFDPCMGSGHILNYAFEILMDMYKSSGYNEHDAAILILENNIYGVDIDDRAYQLAYFSLLMKARKYNRKIFERNIKLNLCSIKESNNLSLDSLNQIIKDDNHIKAHLEYIISLFVDAKEYGSILNIESINLQKINDHLNKLKQSKSLQTLSGLLYSENILNQLYSLVKQTKLLSKQYDVVFTNPPYLHKSRFNPKLSDYVEKNFKSTKNDLATILFQKAIKSFCREKGYISFITINSWMFLKNFEEFREDVVINIQFESIVDFGTELFEGKVGHNPIVAWANKNTSPYKSLTAIKLSEFNYSRRQEKEQEFFNESNKFQINQKKFSLIPGTPIAYWTDKRIIRIFKDEKKLEKICEPKQGLITGNNSKFLKFWFEVNDQSCAFDGSSTKKWFPINKGGKFRRWYGNQLYIINWENEGFEIKNFKDKNGKLRSRPQNLDYNFRDSISWSMITSGKFSARYYPDTFMFNVAGNSCFPEQKDFYYILGLLNTNIVQGFFDIINPTLNTNIGDIANIPIIKNEKYFVKINNLVKENLLISKNDWDFFELSWNFQKHPFIEFYNNNLKETFRKWLKITDYRFNLLKTNEIQLNNIFIKIYQLNGTISDEIANEDISLTIGNLNREIKSFISYAVGCMFGRYCLDEDGLIFAGGQWDSSKYSKFIPDHDNIIPITDSEYFEDDIVGRFIEFVKVTFGDDTLEENLDYIAKALKKKGNTSRDVIRNYFLTDFYKDHKKTYKKHPIYWQFDSGRNNGFKALIYMHRYEHDLVARVRKDYLHKTQKALEIAIAYNDNIIDNSKVASEKTKAVKTKNKLVKQLEETRNYDGALAHVANQKIEIDLDDGVKVNYAKFQGVEVSCEGKKAKKIDLLKNI